MENLINNDPNRYDFGTGTCYQQFYILSRLFNWKLIAGENVENFPQFNVNENKSRRMLCVCVSLCVTWVRTVFRNAKNSIENIYIDFLVNFPVMAIAPTDTSRLRT